MIRQTKCLLACMLALASSCAPASPFDELFNNAAKAAQSAVEAASQALAKAKQRAAASATSAAPPEASSPAPAQLGSRTGGSPDALTTPSPAPSPEAPPVPTAADSARLPSAAWVYRVEADAAARPPASWPISERQDYAAYVVLGNPCSRNQDPNEMFKQDLMARIKLDPHYPEMLGGFAVLNAAATKSPQGQAAIAAMPPAVQCLLILRQTFPEVGRLHYTYYTYKGGQITSKTGDLRQMLLDGAFDASGQKALVPSFANEDLVALAPFQPPPQQLSTQTHSQPRPVNLADKLPPGQRPVPLLKTFSIGSYEAIALKANGDVEVREFDQGKSLNPFQAKVGAGRTLPGVRDVIGVRAQATFDLLNIGSVSLVRDQTGNWLGWRRGEPPVSIPFAGLLEAKGVTQLDPPEPAHMVNLAGGRAALWRLFDDGTVLMSVVPGLLPGTDAQDWQKAHKFTGVKKVLATPGSNGSYRAMFLKTDGTVWANGRNFFQGWLQTDGNEQAQRTNPFADPKLTPLRLPSLSHVRDLAIYWPSTAPGKGVAVLEDGSVAWFKIPVLVGDDALRNLPVVRVPRFAKVRSVAAGAGGVGVVDADGHVWVWGSNPEVISADHRPVPGLRGGATPGADEDEPVMVPGLSDVVDIEFSHVFAGALRTDGTVWIWNHETPFKLFDDVRREP